MWQEITENQSDEDVVNLGGEFTSPDGYTFPSLRFEICILRQKHEQITGKPVIPNSIENAVLHMGF